MATLPASGVLSGGSAVPRVNTCKPYVIEQTFNLKTLLAAVIANADVLNLVARPANHVIIASSLKIVGAGTKDATTFTLQLRDGTTALTAALDGTTANGVAIGGNGTYNHPLAMTTAANLNLLAVVSGGNAVVTGNPTVRIRVLVQDMS